jgi:lysophospholipase L1-like esterase
MSERAPLALLKRILAIGLGLVVALLLSELLVLVLFGEQAKFPRHVVEAGWGLRYNEPGATFRHKSADVNIRFRINSQGMRADRDHPYEKPAGLSRIVSLGDSFTLGYEVELDECFSSIVERELDTAGIPVEVLNAGVSGFSTAEEYLYLERELVRYGPDLVLVSFYTNDLRDNMRSGLFKLEEGELVQVRERYVPAGGLGNFLNTNWFFNLLSERSNAFVFAKERATLAAKAMMVKRQERRLEAAGGEAGGAAAVSTEAAPDPHYRYRLTAAILDRMYDFLHERDIPLVIQSIAEPSDPGEPLQDTFPIEFFDVTRPGVYFVATPQLLAPYLGREPLYNRRSHYHWTPFSHELAGKTLATLIVENHLLGQELSSSD